MLSSNGIDDPDTIKPGSELRILPVKGLEYTVQPDETLADISFKYQVDLGLLLDYNDLNDPDVISIGAKLVVPGGKLRADAVPAPAPVVDAPRTQSGERWAARSSRCPRRAASPRRRRPSLRRRRRRPRRQNSPLAVAAARSSPTR